MSRNLEKLPPPAGRAVGTADLQIAAIALSRRLEAIATRNVGHFADCGVPVINPWEPR
jgi:toxin FitB